MNDILKKRAQTAQEKYLCVIVEFFKQNQDESFTAGDIIKKLGIEPGHHNLFVHGALEVLQERGKLKKVELGFKYRK